MAPRARQSTTPPHTNGAVAVSVAGDGGGRRRTGQVPAVLATVLAVGAMGPATYSVVRFRPWIVGVYLLLAVLLTLAVLLRRPWPRPGPAAPAFGLLAAGGLTWVPTWTYLPSSTLTWCRGLLSTAAVVGALVLLLSGRRPVGGRAAPSAALSAATVVGLAVAAQLAVTAIAVRSDPAPQIDVWYTLQDASDAFADGRSWYQETWLAPPGVMSAFTYLPWTVVLLAPFRWLFGDVRWGIAAAGAVAAASITLLGCRPPWRVPSSGPEPLDCHSRDASSTEPSTAAGSLLTCAGYAALVLLLPGTTTQLEQAWTEPILLAALATAVLAWRRQRLLLATLCLAIGLASKQHLALLLPLLAAWPPIGLRRTIRLGLLSALLVAPWLILDAPAMISDTVGVLVRYPPMRFANSVYILVLNQAGVTLPFWVTGVALLITLTGLAMTLHTRILPLSRLVAAGALVLFVGNLINKQAFYNQYWLVVTMTLLALAVRGTETED